MIVPGWITRGFLSLKTLLRHCVLINLSVPGGYLVLRKLLEMPWKMFLLKACQERRQAYQI
jgi:hypothetical protein